LQARLAEYIPPSYTEKHIPPLTPSSPGMPVKTNTRLCGTLAIVLIAAACAEPVASRVTAPESATLAGKRAAITDTERSEIFPTTFTNPCNGEEVVGTAKYHVVNSFNDTPKGLTYRLTVRMIYDGEGSFGNSYNGQWAFSDEGKFEYSGGMAVGTGVDVRLVSQGKAPNFTSRFDFRFRIDDNGNVTNDSQKYGERCN
jgi:hypothetical protein